MRAVEEMTSCILAVLMCFLHEAATSGVLNIRITDFSDPRGRAFDGSCCDSTPRDTYSTCLDQCDYVMRLIVSGLGRANDHVFLFHRPLKYDSNDIAFEAGDSNMVLSVLFDRWPQDDHVKMNAFFYDYDDLDHTTTLVDWFETDLHLATGDTGSDKSMQHSQFRPETVLGNREKDKTLLRFEWATMCHERDECSLVYPIQDGILDSQEVTYNTDIPSGSSLVLAAHTAPTLRDIEVISHLAGDVTHSDAIEREEFRLTDEMPSTENSLLPLSTEMYNSLPYLDSEEVSMIIRNREPYKHDGEMEQDGHSGHQTSSVTADIISSMSQTPWEDKKSNFKDYYQDFKRFNGEEKFLHLHPHPKRTQKDSFAKGTKVSPYNRDKTIEELQERDESSVNSDIESERQPHSNSRQLASGAPFTTAQEQSDGPYYDMNQYSTVHGNRFTTELSRRSSSPQELHGVYTLDIEYLDDPNLLMDLQAFLTQEIPGRDRQTANDSVHIISMDKEIFYKDIIRGNQTSLSPESDHVKTGEPLHQDAHTVNEDPREDLLQRVDQFILEGEVDQAKSTLDSDLSLKTNTIVDKTKPELVFLSTSTNKYYQTSVPTLFSTHKPLQEVKNNIKDNSHKKLRENFDTEIIAKEQGPRGDPLYSKFDDSIGKSKQTHKESRNQISAAAAKDLYRAKPRSYSSTKSKLRPKNSDSLNIMGTSSSTIPFNDDNVDYFIGNLHSTFDVSHGIAYRESEKVPIKNQDKVSISTTSPTWKKSVQSTNSFRKDYPDDKAQSRGSALLKPTNTVTSSKGQASARKHPYPNLISTSPTIVKNSVFTNENATPFRKRLNFSTKKMLFQGTNKKEESFKKFSPPKVPMNISDDVDKAGQLSLLSVTEGGYSSDSSQLHLHVSTTTPDLYQGLRDKVDQEPDRHKLSAFENVESMTQSVDTFSSKGYLADIITTNRNLILKTADDSESSINTSPPSERQHRSTANSQRNDNKNYFEDKIYNELVTQQNPPNSRLSINSLIGSNQRNPRKTHEEKDFTPTERAAGRKTGNVQPSFSIQHDVDASSREIRLTTHDYISPSMKMSYVQETKPVSSYQSKPTSNEGVMETMFEKPIPIRHKNVTRLSDVFGMAEDAGQITHQMDFPSTIKHKTLAQHEAGSSNEIQSGGVTARTNPKPQSDNPDFEPTQDKAPDLALSTTLHEADLRQTFAPESKQTWLGTRSITEENNNLITDPDDKKLNVDEKGPFKDRSGEAYHTPSNDYGIDIFKVPPITVYKSLKAFNFSRSLITDVSQTRRFSSSLNSVTGKNIIATTTASFVNSLVDTEEAITHNVSNQSGDLSLSSVFKQIRSISNKIQDVLKSKRTKPRVTSTTKSEDTNVTPVARNHSTSNSTTHDASYSTSLPITRQGSSDRASQTYEHSILPSSITRIFPYNTSNNSKLISDVSGSPNFNRTTPYNETEASANIVTSYGFTNCSGRKAHQFCKSGKFGGAEAESKEPSHLENLRVDQPSYASNNSGHNSDSLAEEPEDSAENGFIQPFSFIISILKNYTIETISQSSYSPSPDTTGMDRNLSANHFSANISKILHQHDVDTRNNFVLDESNLGINSMRPVNAFDIDENTANDRHGKVPHQSSLNSFQGTSFKHTILPIAFPSNVTEKQKNNFTDDQPLSNISHSVKISELLANITEISSLLSTLNFSLGSANSTAFGLKDGLNTSEKAMKDGEKILTSPVMERLKHPSNTLDYALYGMGEDGKYVGHTSESPSQSHADSESNSRRVHVTSLTKRTPNANAAMARLFNKPLKPRVTLPEAGFILHTHQSTGHKQDKETLSTEGFDMVSSENEPIPSTDHLDDANLPALHIPFTALYMPGSVTPVSSENISLDSDADSRNETGLFPHPVERYGSPRPTLTDVGHVLSRHWPAVLGVTTGTVFLLTALVTSILCRQRRLLVQRSRWVDSPQHLNEPPSAVSEYATSSATSLSSSDVTRASANLV